MPLKSGDTIPISEGRRRQARLEWTISMSLVFPRFLKQMPEVPGLDPKEVVNPERKLGKHELAGLISVPNNAAKARFKDPVPASETRRI